MHNKKPVIVLALLMLFVSGCEEGPRVILAPDYEIDEFAPTQVFDYTPAPSDPEPTPTPPPFTISGKTYSLPSNAMSFLPPLLWEIDAESDNYVKYISRDKRAFFEAGFESTGYDLDAEAFENYVDNAIAALYAQSEQFEILEDSGEVGQRMITSQFNQNGLVWKTRDVYVQRNFVIYFFSFHTLENDWDYYLPGFIQIYESLETITRYVTNDQLNEFTTIYVDPSNTFRVRKPIGWSVSGPLPIDAETETEILQSPDGLAAFQTIIHKPKDVLTPDNLGQTASALLHEIIAEDMEFVEFLLLPDGRIRQDWVSDANGSSGFSFFWIEQYDLYVICFSQDNEKEGVYQQANYQIGDSFKFLH